MATAEYYAETVRLLFKWLECAENGDADVTDIERWLTLNTEAAGALEKLMTSATLSRAQKHKCQTSMTHLLSIQHKLRSLLKTGGRLQQDPPAKMDRVQWDDMPSAFQKRIRSGVISNLNHLDIVSFMDDAQSLFQLKIAAILEEYNALKVNVELSAEYVIQKSDSVSAEVKYFNNENASLHRTTDLKKWFDFNVRQPIQRQMEEFQEKDSGWTLRRILSLAINVNKFDLMKGNSYIPLPDSIDRKHACVNVQNQDDQCFKWAVLSALHPQKRNAHRVNQYKQFENELNFRGIDFPVPPKQISKFEKQNHLSINVYTLEKKSNQYEVQPFHVTSLKKETHVNLLLVQDYYVDEDNEKEEETEDDNDAVPRFHYMWIKNLSRLVRSQLTNCKRQCYICDRCLHFFKTADMLAKHEIDCQQLNKCKILLPSPKNSILSFNSYNRQIKVPYVIYADCECLLKPIDDNERAYQQHQVFSIGYYLKCSFDQRRSVYRSYRQEDDAMNTPTEWLVQNLREIANELEELYKKPEPMNLSLQEIQYFMIAKSCSICGKAFSPSDKKVRDHCHITGRFRGAAHAGCNVNLKDARFIPVVFHNLTGYDAHFIIKELATSTILKGRVTLIPENKERYISFIKHINGSDINFRFIDSFRFMPSSLEKLASYLEKYDITSRAFEQDGYSEHQIKLLLRKGVFPYDYVSSFEKLQERQLPSRDDFFSKLNDCGIADAQYDHAKDVWSTFNIATLGEYSDLYLKTDVLLLADVFENFRSTCIEAYGLDPAHYFTTPGLTWDAMLKYTKVQLELLTDIDILLFIERGIRGGVSQCSNRYAKANNKFMNDDYKPDKEETYLMYYDANNLYGWAMTQYLPSGGFQWVDVETLNIFEVLDDSPIGYILEVDLEYPVGIHEAHKDLPLCPEHRAPPGSKQKKLLTTLYNKKRYVIHYRALKQAVEHGVVCKETHRALQFKQSQWLKPYVELNTQKRKESKNEFDKLFFKLLINAVYGKTMENERKRVNVKLVSKWEGRYGAEVLIARPNFHSCSIFAENLVAIQLSRTEITIRKPIYVGLCVLDVSKILIYDFHYSYMRKRVGDKCKLLYTDTDSLIYEIKSVNMYEIMKEDIDKFDTSDYPEDNQFGLPRRNKKVIGLMKDECNGKIMTEFIGLRSKMYSVRIQNEKPIKKAKGIKAAVVKNSITFEDYFDCLFNQIKVRRQQHNIRSRLHVVRTETEEKLALSPHDDKRCLLPNKTDTLPWGHFRTLDDEILLEAARQYESGDSNVVVVGEAPERGEGLLKELKASVELIPSIAECEEPPSKCLKLDTSADTLSWGHFRTLDDEILLEAAARQYESRDSNVVVVGEAPERGEGLLKELKTSVELIPSIVENEEPPASV